jgi:excisionase family DNA binding protein
MTNLNIQNEAELPIVLTPKQMAELLQIGKTRAYELCHVRGFPAKRIGKTFRIPRNALLEWLNTHDLSDPTSLILPSYRSS